MYCVLENEIRIGCRTGNLLKKIVTVRSVSAFHNMRLDTNSG